MRSKGSKIFELDESTSTRRSLTLLSNPVTPARRTIRSPLQYDAPAFPSDELFAYIPRHAIDGIDLPQCVLNNGVSCMHRAPYLLERSARCLRATFITSIAGMWPAQDYSVFKLIMNKGRVFRYECNCSLLYGVDVINGALVATERNMFFLEGAAIRDASLFCVHARTHLVSQRSYMQSMQSGQFGQCLTYKGHFLLVWPVSELIAVTGHRWIQKPTALTVNFALGYSFVLNFSTQDYPRERSFLLRGLNAFFFSAPPPTLTLTPVSASRILLKSVRVITGLWVNGSINNFMYLSIVNRLGERCFADLTQFPVFPWVMSDYSSESLSLANVPLRDLAKPMGQIGEKRAERFEAIYRDSDPHFYYGTHYMHFGVVLYFLFRIDPFPIFFFILHRGYDHPNRLFLKIQEAWNTGAFQSPSDVKELIPQCYKVPEFLENAACLPLTQNHEGHDLNEVVLPPWAVNRRHFIGQCLEVLESRRGSQSLNGWIDLIFGVNSRGSGAAKSKNLFPMACYPESAQDIDHLDEIEKGRYGTP